jgi:hypothetical protein
MCDPLTIGALAIGAAGTAANSIGQAKAMKKQESEYNSWAAYQNKIRGQENIRQEDLRKQAETARQQGVQDISAENQQKEQTDEQARLAKLMSGEGDLQPAPNPTVPLSAADPKLSGSSGGGEVFQSDLARKLSDAAASAKQRIGALATVNSYGGSWGGLGTVNPLNQQAAGSGIDAPNEMRRGSLAAYGTERSVDPKQISYSNPIADIASGFLGVGLQGVGGALAGGGGLGGGSLSLGKTIGSAFKPNKLGSLIPPITQLNTRF